MFLQMTSMTEQDTNKKPIAFVVYGCHGSGKTYIAKQIAKLHNATYISTDFAEVCDTSKHNLEDMVNIQEKYVEYVLKKYRELINNPLPNNKIVIDFGAYQVIPYNIYFQNGWSKNKIKRIERYEKRLEEIYNVKRLLVMAHKDIVRYRIEKRKEIRNKNFELKILDEIYTMFAEMPQKYNMEVYWNNGNEKGAEVKNLIL